MPATLGKLSIVILDECIADSGPLHIWPDSHKLHLQHESMDNGLQVSQEDIDFDGGMDVLVSAGSILIFHVLLIHNSRPNVSGCPRRIMIYSHYPQQADMGIDIRNGPGRLRESPHEWEYVRQKQSGDFTDSFHAPNLVMT